MNYIVSDIHGEYGLFCRLMDKVGFSGGDRLFVLGDILGKGADELRLARLTFSMPEATVIAGNHEYDFVKYYRALVSGYGEEAAVERARDYFADGKLFSPELAAAFDSLPFYIETEDFVGVHAGLPLSADGGVVPPGEARREQLVYDRRFKDPDVLPHTGKCVVFGHTPTRYVSDRDDILFYGEEGERTGGRRADRLRQDTHRHRRLSQRSAGVSVHGRVPRVLRESVTASASAPQGVRAARSAHIAAAETGANGCV